MAENTQGRAIFISYRRDDSEGEAGRLFDDLVRAYGDNSVFMDVTGIQPGLDFRKAIDDNVSSCGVLLAVVGPNWATITGKDGTRRLDNSDDYVRLEIASALKRSIPVIPVLVHDAHMPALDQLPDDLKDLRYRNSVELSHARWNSDVALLIGALKSYVNANPAHETETVHATIPVQLPAPQPVTPPEPAPKSKLPLWIGLGVASVIMAVAIFALMHPKPVPGPNPAPVPTPTDPTAAFLGQWQNVETPPFGDNLIRVEVSADTSALGGRFLVHAWGRCKPDLCDWGEHHARLNGDELVTEVWNLTNTPEEQNQQRSAVIRARASGTGLTVTVRNTWHPKGETEPKQVETHLQFSKGFHGDSKAD